MTVVLDVPVNPVPLQRPRVVVNAGPASAARARAFTPDPTGFAETFQWQLRALGVRRPLAGDLAVRMEFYRRHDAGHRKRGDLDNLIKAVLDAGNGFLWEDDHQVVELHARFVDHGPDVDGRIVLELDQAAA